MSSVDLLLRNATCLLPDATETHLESRICDIAVKDGKIFDLGPALQVTAKQIVDLEGLHLLPGIIDSQVHFREPGMTHKEDLESGTLGALYGGVTTVFEMPNTQPNTTTRETFEDKLQRAQGRCHTHYAFYLGASGENYHNLPELQHLPHCPGIKIFMGSSTGTLLVDDDTILEQIVSSTRKLLIVHSEDEKRLKERKHLALESRDVKMHPIWRDEESAMISTRKIVGLAEKYHHRIHVLHVSSAGEMEFLAKHKDFISVEVLPQHLTLSAPDCYEKIGTLAQQNPPIREAHHREALWQGIHNGTVDVIGSDHAPHTLEEKAQPYPQSPSGVPGVQTMVPIMLDHVHNGRLTLEKFAELVTLNPKKIFGIKNKGLLKKNYDADFTVLDLKKVWTLENSWMKSRSQWTPFHGKEIHGGIHSVYLNGLKVLENDQLLHPHQGEGVEFEKL